MPYDLRSSSSSKRALSALAPRPTKRAKLALASRTSYDILNKTISRPLSLFESLFTAYPVVQNIVEYLPTPDAMMLSMASPALRRMLQANSAFHTFSNQRNVFGSKTPIKTLQQFRACGTNHRFTDDGNLNSLLENYIDAASITRLVLDWTDVNLRSIVKLAKSANLKLLSLRHCLNIDIDGLQFLFDRPFEEQFLLDYQARYPWFDIQRSRPPLRSLEDLKVPISCLFMSTPLTSIQDLGRPEDPMDLCPYEWAIPSELRNCTDYWCLC